MQKFKAEIFIIGVNPYVYLPQTVLQGIMQNAKKNKGPIPVKIRINKSDFAQTLVRYAGEWRLYLNTPMRKAAGKDVGDEITISVEYDAAERTTLVHPKLKNALEADKEAQLKFDNLPPSRKKEIARYINNLKSDEAIERNVARAINFLRGSERFIGRDKP